MERQKFRVLNSGLRSYNSALKTYRAAHPNMAYRAAQKKVSDIYNETVAGVRGHPVKRRKYVSKKKK